MISPTLAGRKIRHVASFPNQCAARQGRSFYFGTKIAETRYICSKSNSMAQPITKTPETLYRSKFNNGTYRISYQAPSGAKRPGIPHDDMTDIVNLTKVGGSTNATPFIVTSEADFKSNFTETTAIKSDFPTKAPTK
jgi:hypothetical protein